MTTDITFIENQARFRYRAAAVIIEEGAVAFMTNPDENYYYSLGGAVQLGESSKEALLREIREETGQEYDIDKLLFVQENFFHETTGRLAGLDSHEVAFYYLMKSKGQQFPSLNKDETLQWIPLDKMDQYKVFPNFLPQVLKQQSQGIQHIISRE